jgi:hypothetical protein
MTLPIAVRDGGQPCHSLTPKFGTRGDGASFLVRGSLDPQSTFPNSPVATAAGLFALSGFNALAASFR